MTLHDYLATPESVQPQELIFGTFRVADSPLPQHQRAVAQLFRALDAHVREKNLGEVWLSPIDVILDAARHLVVQPDLLFISHARSHILTDRIRGAPDLVVEVLSPHPRIGEANERLAWFAAYGVAECWLVNLLVRRIEILTFEDGKTAARQTFAPDVPLASRLLPAFSRRWDDIFGF